MSLMFTILDEGEARGDDVLDDPNPENAGEINDANGQPVLGLNDGAVGTDIQRNPRYFCKKLVRSVLWNLLSNSNATHPTFPNFNLFYKTRCSSTLLVFTTTGGAG